MKDLKDTNCYLSCSVSNDNNFILLSTSSKNNNVSDVLNINGSSDANTSNDIESYVNNGVVNDNDIIISLLVASMGNERANILNINSIPVNDN